MAVLGYCPGASVGPLADGSRHAIFGVLGMLVVVALGFGVLERWERKRAAH